MEKDVRSEAYVTFDLEAIKSLEVEGKRQAQASDYEKNILVFEDAFLESSEIYFDKDTSSLICGGDISFNGKKVAYISPTIPLSNNTIIEIIEYYMKKLGKLKTIMEALKD